MVPPMKTGMRHASVLLGVLGLLRCGSGEPSPLQLGARDSENVTLALSVDDVQVELESTPSGPLAGVVSVHVASYAGEATAPLSSYALNYELRYDYAAGVVTSDGHGGQLDRQSLRVLGDAADRLSHELGSDDPTLPLHEQMLFAALVLLSESGGMPLGPLTFEMNRGETSDGNSSGSKSPSSITDKSLGDDGVSCLQRGSTYLVSFNFASTAVVDLPIVADSRSCNGMCGPSCTQLTPWRMWTLDCLEHDSCCSAIGDGTTCWTPLGECGDEYVVAETDFLRGFDPLRRHCGG
jgi:hypothetical protein